MAEIAQFAASGSTKALAAADAAAQARQLTSPNGVRYATYGELNGDGVSITEELPRLVQTVPVSMTPALAQTVYYFVPLALTAEETTDTARDLDKRNMPAFIASAYSLELADRAICHRNVHLGAHEGVFLSSRLHNDKFALAFEFFINVAHGFIDIAGVPEEFTHLLETQVAANVKGESSHDTWESRTAAAAGVDEKKKSAFYESAFVDAIAIYLLSLYMDFDYADLREREYPLLAPQALAARLRVVAATLPPNPGYTFEIKYKRPHFARS